MDFFNENELSKMNMKVGGEFVYNDIECVCDFFECLHIEILNLNIAESKTVLFRVGKSFMSAYKFIE